MRQGDPKPIRVLLVDDQQLLTDALAQVLAREPDIDVVGVAGTVAEAKALARVRLDVVFVRSIHDFWMTKVILPQNRPTG